MPLQPVLRVCRSSCSREVVKKAIALWRLQGVVPCAELSWPCRGGKVCPGRVQEQWRLLEREIIDSMLGLIVTRPPAYQSFRNEVAARLASAVASQQASLKRIWAAEGMPLLRLWNTVYRSLADGYCFVAAGRYFKNGRCRLGAKPGLGQAPSGDF